MPQENVPTLRAVRHVRRPGQVRFPTSWRGPIVCLLLVACLLACVGYATASSARRLDFPVDQLPLGVGLRNTYGIEHNAGGSYVWTKTSTVLTLPVERPGDYRLTLALQSSPAADPRLVRVFANGQLAAAFLPGEERRVYALDWALDPRVWHPGLSELRVEIEVAPFFAPGDDRPLGIILAQVAFEPVGVTGGPMAVLPPWLFLTLGLLVVGQLGGMPWRWRAGLLAAAVAAGLGLVLWDRAVSLDVALQPMLHPWLVFNGVAVAALAALAIGPIGRGRVPVVPAVPTTVVRQTSGRRALDLLIVAIPLVWTVVVVGVVVAQAAGAWREIAPLLRYAPRRVESLQFAGVIFAYTLLGGALIRATKPRMAAPTLVAIFAVGMVALATGAGAIGALALLLLLILAWYELGRWVLVALGVLPRGWLEAGVMAFAIGSGCFALWVLLVGSLGLLYPLVIAIPTVALVTSLVFRRVRALLAPGVSSPQLVPDRLLPVFLLWIPSWFETVLLGQVVGFALIGGAAGLGPEVMSDAFRVHLAVARQFVAEHLVYGIADQRFTLWPIHGQLLFTAGMALGGPLLAKLVHTATGIAAIAAVGAVGNRLGRTRTAGVVAATLFASLPVTVLELGSGLVDHFVALYGIVALLCISHFLASRDRRWALLLGAVLGFGLAAKLTFGFLIVGTFLALVVGLARRYPLRLLLGPLVAVGLGLALSSGVWLLRTAWLTGEIPGLSLLLGALGLSSGQLAATVGNLPTFGTGRSVVSFLRLPWDLSVASSRFGENQDGFVGFALLLLLPCLIVLPRRRQILAAIAFAAVPFALWFGTAQYTRYLLPTLASLTVLLGVAVVHLQRRLAQIRPVGPFAARIQAAALSLVLLSSVVFYFATFLVYPGSLPVRVVLDRESPETYLGQTLANFEATHHLDMLVTPGTAVAAIPDGPGLYTQARLIAPFSVEPGLIWAETIPQLLATFERYDITYLLINHAALPETWRGFLILRREFLDGYTDRVFTAGGATLYRLRQPGGQMPGGELLRDPSFEGGADRASPWQPIGDAPTPAAAFNQGRLAIAVNGRAGYYQAAPVQGEQGYRLRFASRSNALDALVEMRVDWFNSAGILVESSANAVPLTSEWADYSLWRPAPAGAVTAVVYILARNAVTCWFDDYSFAPAK